MSQGGVSLTGKDTGQIDGNIITTMVEGTPFDIAFPEVYGEMKVGKNGNAIYAKNSMGTIADVTLRVLLGGIDDQYLTGRMAQWDQNESAFVLLTAMFVKHVGDGAGNVTTKIYNMTGGIFRRGVPAKTVSEADVEQCVAIYNMRFLCPPPSIQG
jgi:hypothetical protein